MTKTFTLEHVADLPAVEFHLDPDNLLPVYLNSETTFELTDDGKLVVNVPAVWRDNGRVDGWVYSEETKTPITFWSFELMETGNIHGMSEAGEAELRCIAKDCALGQALRALGVVDQDQPEHFPGSAAAIWPTAMTTSPDSEAFLNGGHRFWVEGRKLHLSLKVVGEGDQLKVVEPHQNIDVEPRDITFEELWLPPRDSRFYTAAIWANYKHLTVYIPEESLLARDLIDRGLVVRDDR